MSTYPEHRLLDSQEAAVFNIIKGAGFDPIEFGRETTVGSTYNGVVPRLIHRPTDSTFVFDFDRGRESHAVAYTPGEQKPWDTAYLLDWPSVTLYVRLWLKNVERERSTPNLWAELDKQRELLAATAPDSRDSDNTPFNPQEQAQVAAQLNEIRELLVRTQQLEGERLRAIEVWIDYLLDASTRMGRRDWLNIFIGGIFAWALEGLVPPDGVREVLAFAAHGLGHLFGGGVPQLPMA